MSDIEFPEGIIVKAPHPRAPEFVKASISINCAELMAWLKNRADEWVNLDVKESRGGKWYACVNTYKPKSEPKAAPPQEDAPFADDDVPF